MADFKTIAKELFEKEGVNLFIGYSSLSTMKYKPMFALSADQADKMTYDENCTYNLAVYVNKHEVQEYGKLALVANVAAVRTIVQLASENQIKEGDVILVAMDNSGNATILKSFDDMSAFAKGNYVGLKEMAQQKIKEVSALSREEKWSFWTKEFSRCMKCYACRAACPMCYCTQCTVENNKPQFVPLAPHSQGNLEWHMMRAMHLVGRCIDCGQCVAACPVDIPMAIMTAKLNSDIKEMFDWQSGMEVSNSFALGNFKESDKENFIR